MRDFVASPTVRSAALLAVLSVIVAIAVRVVSSFRDYDDDDQQSADDLLSNLEEMRLKGDITDEEFRTMKARTHLHLDQPSDEESSVEVEDSSET